MAHDDKIVQMFLGNCDEYELTTEENAITAKLAALYEFLYADHPR